MKTFNKVVIMFFIMMVCFIGTSFSEASTSPIFTPDISSGSVVEPGDRVTVVIEAGDPEAFAIQSCTYSWNGGATKSIFDASGLIGQEGKKRKITFGFETFPDEAGVYVLRISATDTLNNFGSAEFKYTVKEKAVEIDTKAPTITSSIADNSTVEAGKAVTIVVEDNEALKEIKYSWDGGTTYYPLDDEPDDKLFHKYTIYMAAFSNKNETFKLNVVASDISGNVTTKDFTYNVVYNDPTKPIITMTKESGSVVEPGTNLTMVVEDNESRITSLKYNWEGSSEKNIIPGMREPVNKCTVKDLIIGSLPGRYILHITAINSVGMKSTATYEYIVLAQDTSIPTISADPSSGEIEPQAEIKLTAKDNEALKTIIYKWDNNSSIEKPISGTESVTYVIAPTTSGKHTLNVIVVDKSNNKVEGNYKYTITETNKPTVAAEPASGNKIEPQEVIKLIARDNEELKTLIYNWNSNEKITKSISGTEDEVFVTAPNINGRHTLYVTVIDASENEGKGEFVYIISDNEKPTVVVNPNGGNANVGDPVKIIGRDNEGLENIIYNWDNEIPAKKPVGGKEASIETEVPNSPGKHTLHVTVEDEAGNKVSDNVEFVVSDDEAPTITMNPKSGSTVKGGKVVKATLKDNIELKKVTYNWEGDSKKTENISGTSKTINLPALPYKEGTYRVTITVEDNVGHITTGKYTYYVEDDDEDEEYPTVDADPDGGEVEYGDKITITADDEDGEVEYVEYYWDDDDDDTTIKYDDKFTVKVPSKEGKHYLYVRAMDDDDNLCDYERFTYYIEENNYPGNSDIIGDLNNRVRAVRVEIRNADDKIRFEPEEDILYYVDYYNGTSSDVKNAKLVVDLPTYLEAEEASDNGKITTKQVTWNLGTLEAGEYGRVSFIAQYTSSKVNEKIITVPAKIYSGNSLKDTSTTRNMIFCEGASGTGSHQAYCVGYPDGTFLAEGRITRAELASMIANIEGITATHRGQFTDAKNHWAANYMQAVVDRGYMIPKSYNRFGAQDYATRADLAYAIAAILDVEDLEPIFISATDTKNSDARCAIEQLLRLGIMDGYSDGTAKPNSTITRAEAVTIINNYLFRGELYTKGYNYAYNFETNYNHGGNYYILRFTDLSTNHWAYGHIMEATNNHRYERVMDGNEEML